MKVLHVAPYYEPSWAFGGIPRLLSGLCSEQIKKGIDVVVLTTDVLNPTRRVDLPRCRYSKNVQIFTIPNLSHTLAHKQIFIPYITTQLKKSLPVFDIIHLHGYRNLLLQWAQYFAKKNDIPQIYTPNGCLQIHESRHMKKKLWDCCFPVPKNNKWIAVSQLEKSLMSRDFDIPMSNISVIPNGIEQQEFIDTQSHQRSDCPNTIKIGYMGQLSKRKGVLDLIAAFLCLPHQQNGKTIELHIAGGDMGEYQSIQKMISRSSDSKKRSITLHGILEGNKRLEFLQNIDIFVYPSKNEIFGIAVFEALMCGCSVIVGDDSGCGEWIKKADAGILIPTRQPQKIEDAIRWSLDVKNQDTILMQKKNGVHFIKENLFYSSIAAKYIKEYQNICNSHV